jgi:fructan beta-fructosidase
MKDKINNTKDYQVKWNRLAGKAISVIIFLFLVHIGMVKATDRVFKIDKKYLNIPVGNRARMKLIKINVNGISKREFPVQLAEDS